MCAAAEPPTRDGRAAIANAAPLGPERASGAREIQRARGAEEDEVPAKYVVVNCVSQTRPSRREPLSLRGTGVRLEVAELTVNKPQQINDEDLVRQVVGPGAPRLRKTEDIQQSKHSTGCDENLLTKFGPRSCPHVRSQAEIVQHLPVAPNSLVARRSFKTKTSFFHFSFSTSFHA